MNPSKQEIADDLKPDAFLVAAEKAQGFAKKHQQTVILAVAGVVVIGLGAALFMNRQGAAQDEASAALTEVQKLYDRSPAGTAEDKFKTSEEWLTALTAKLTEVSGKYGDSNVGNVVNLYLANLAMDKGDAASAEKHLRAFIDKGGAADLVGVAQLSLATVYEDQNKLDEAYKIYLPLLPAAGEKSPKPFSDEALFRAARINERQGKAAEARAKYEQLTKDFATSQYRFKAQTRLTALPGAAVQ